MVESYWSWYLLRSGKASAETKFELYDLADEKGSREQREQIPLEWNGLQLLKDRNKEIVIKRKWTKQMEGEIVFRETFQL